MKKMLITLVALVSAGASLVADCGGGCCPKCTKTVQIEQNARPVIECQRHWVCPPTCDTPNRVILDN